MTIPDTSDSGEKSTDPDAPFRRSPSASGDYPNATAAIAPAADPVVLDPGFHQSVWKPWQDSTEQSPAQPSGPGAAVGPVRRRPRRLVLGLVVVVTLGLVAALLIPRFLSPETWRGDYLVADISGTPRIAWTADGGQRCHVASDENHAIFSDATSVWSLDLRDGSTRWKVDPAWNSSAVLMACGWRSSDLGVISISGLRKPRCNCRRRMWK